MEAHMSVAADRAESREQSIDSFERQLILGAAPVAARRAERSRVRAQLAPWQVTLAKEMMLAATHRQLSMTAVATRLGLSTNHFIKAFRNTVGVAPYHWYMLQRIAQALAMLRDDDLTLSKIADACGFADQSHFNKAFKRLLGIAPGKWRRRCKAGTLPSNEQRLPEALIRGDGNPRLRPGPR